MADKPRPSASSRLVILSATSFRCTDKQKGHRVSGGPTFDSSFHLSGVGVTAPYSLPSRCLYLPSPLPEESYILLRIEAVSAAYRALRGGYSSIPLRLPHTSCGDAQHLRDY